MDQEHPFYFFTERRVVELTGVFASNLPDLAVTLSAVPASSIFYHTHHKFLAHHFEKPVVYNDFAVWVSEALQEEALGEKLAAVDLMAFTKIRDLRAVVVRLVEARLKKPEKLRECPFGDEFHFSKSKSFILPTHIVAHDAGEFFAKLPTIANSSLYFHFLEARLRLGRPTNDFSDWLKSQDLPKLAQAIDQLDPYRLTLDELKEDLVRLGSKYGVN